MTEQTRHSVDPQDNVIQRVSRRLKWIAGRLAKEIDKVAGVHVPFSLFVWTEGRCSYISTAARPEVYAVLTAMLAGWREGGGDGPAHELATEGLTSLRTTEERLQAAQRGLLVALEWNEQADGYTVEQRIVLVNALRASGYDGPLGVGPSVL